MTKSTSSFTSSSTKQVFKYAMKIWMSLELINVAQVLLAVHEIMMCETCSPVVGFAVAFLVCFLVGLGVGLGFVTGTKFLKHFLKPSLIWLMET